MKRFSAREKERALSLYFDEKLTTAETVRRLGYPTRQNLERWLKNDSRYGSTFCHGFYPVDVKMQVVESYRSGKVPLAEIARVFNLSNVTTILNWVKIADEFGYNGLIPKSRSACMPKRKTPQIGGNDEEIRQRCEALELENAVLRETIEVLKKIHASIRWN